jgi:hypothetical protein
MWWQMILLFLHLVTSPPTWTNSVMLKMGAVHSSEMSEQIRLTTWHKNPKDSHYLQSNCHEILMPIWMCDCEHLLGCDAV